MRKELEYSALATFVALHKKDLKKFIVNDLYLNTGFASATCESYSIMSDSFLELMGRKYKNAPINIVRSIIEEWFLKYQGSLTYDSVTIIESVLIKAVEVYSIDHIESKMIKRELELLLEIMYSLIRVANLKIVEPHMIEESDRITEIVEILLSNQEQTGIIYTLRKIEEIFSFKRSSYYAYIPETDGIKAIFGQDMQRIKTLKETLTSQKPFDLAYQTKKAVYIKDCSLHFDRQLVEEFNLVSMVIVPVYSQKMMCGWLLLDNIGVEFSKSPEVLTGLERVARLLGTCIDIKGLYAVNDKNELFSTREYEVLTLLTEGFDNKEIGKELHISSNTVRDYISQLMVKLDARNRTHLVSIALRKKFIK